MIKLLNNKEKREFVKNFSSVKEAPNAKEAEKEAKFYRTHYDYALIDTPDGEIAFKFDVPSIRRTIYYDDFTDDPTDGCDTETLEQVFINYNLFYFRDYGTEKWLEEYEACKDTQYPCTLQPYIEIYPDMEYQSAASFKEYPIEIERDYNNKSHKYILTEEQALEFAKVVSELKEKYIQRLKRYFKRYSDKITSYGYWADC